MTIMVIVTGQRVTWQMIVSKVKFYCDITIVMYYEILEHFTYKRKTKGLIHLKKFD